MEIIFNEETQGIKEYITTITEVLSFASKKLKADKKTELLINFVDLIEIRELNLSSRGIDKSTDVLSFPYLDIEIGKSITPSKYKYDINPETGNVMLGEIYICTEILKKQALEYGHSEKREAAFLALHGLLHVLGYDHIEEEDKKLMRAKEEEILSECKITR